MITMELIADHSPTYTELTPVQLSDNTEVKVPVVSSYPTNGQVNIKVEDSFNEYPTESIIGFDNNYTQFGPSFTQSHYTQLQSFVRGLPKSMFVNAIKKNYASCEVRMEEVRSHLFIILK